MNYYEAIFRGLSYGSSVFNTCFFNSNTPNRSGNSPHLSFFMGPLGNANGYSGFSAGGAVDFREPTKPSSMLPEKLPTPSLVVPAKADPVAAKPPENYNNIDGVPTDQIPGHPDQLKKELDRAKKIEEENRQRDIERENNLLPGQKLILPKQVAS